MLPVTEERRVTFDEDAVKAWSEHPPELAPVGLEESLGLEQQLEWALKQLPPMQALVLLAHKRDGLSYEEIAREQGLSMHTVQKYLVLARARMRTLSWDR
jgi:DNA-directed RNA polymerase specialized sigma24 family protein